MAEDAVKKADQGVFRDAARLEKEKKAGERSVHHLCEAAS